MNTTLLVTLTILILLGIAAATYACHLSERPTYNQLLYSDIEDQWDSMSVDHKYGFCSDWIDMTESERSEFATDVARSRGNNEGDGLGTVFPFYTSQCEYPEKIFIEELGDKGE